MRDEYRDAVLRHYRLVAFTLPGEPVRYVGCAIRNDAVGRILAAGRAPPQRR